MIFVLGICQGFKDECKWFCIQEFIDQQRRGEKNGDFKQNLLKFKIEMLQEKRERIFIFMRGKLMVFEMFKVRQRKVGNGCWVVECEER